MKTTLNPLILALATALATAAFPAAAATFSLNPAADAFVTTGPTGNLSNSNYGGAGALSVAAPGLGRGEFQSVLRFDLSGARSFFDAQYGAGGWGLQSISLSFTATTPGNPIFNPTAAGQFDVSWLQNDSWIEGSGTPQSPSANGITFAALPGFLGAGDENLGGFAFNGATSGTATYSLSLTPGFAADAAAGNLVSFRLFAADAAVSYLFDSGSFGTVAARPVLTITAIPEPVVASFLVLGALALAGRHGCRRAKPPRQPTPSP
jgi:hypothetical protein